MNIKKLIAIFFIIISLIGYNKPDVVFAVDSNESFTKTFSDSLQNLVFSNLKNLRSWASNSSDYLVLKLWQVVKFIICKLFILPFVAFKAITWDVCKSCIYFLVDYEPQNQLIYENVELKERAIKLTKKVEKLKENDKKIKFFEENFSYLQELFIKCLNDSNCSKSLRKLDNFNETFLK